MTSQPKEIPSSISQVPESTTSSPLPWTILRLLEWTTTYLRDHGSSSPRLDAEVLLAHARNCKRIDLYTAFDQPASDELRTAFRELVKQRAQGAPVAYLVGTREFFSRSFQVGPGVLVPRPETEFVIVTLLDLIRQSGLTGQSLRIADVGTGSGAIAITAALELPLAEVVALDVSPEALDIAGKNIAHHELQARITCHQSDLFSGMDRTTQFDFILSNPPYVSEAEFAQLPRDVRDFEPRIALVAGNDGTSIIDRLISAATERLVPGGWLICEISPRIERAVTELFVRAQVFEPPSVRRDYAHLPRVVYAKRKPN